VYVSVQKICKYLRMAPLPREDLSLDIAFFSWKDASCIQGSFVHANLIFFFAAVLKRSLSHKCSVSSE
jgi:hypothetical protein